MLLARRSAGLALPAAASLRRANTAATAAASSRLLLLTSSSPSRTPSSSSLLHRTPSRRSFLAPVHPFCSSATITSSNITDHPHQQQQHHHPEAAEYLQRAAQDEDADALFDKTSALMEVEDRPGALAEMLSIFAAHHVNITRLESRPSKKQLDGKFTFVMYIDFDGSRGEAHVDALLHELGQHSHNLLVLDKTDVPWFPRQAAQLDAIANRVLDAGVDLTSDHPGFSDPVYRARRGELAEVARKYKHGEVIPRIEYTKEEVETWKAVWKRQEELLQRHACKEYLEILGLMKQECGYGPESIPQQADITKFLSRRTGFRLRPVAGLLSSRDFLNALAFRVFPCTQYIR